MSTAEQLRDDIVRQIETTKFGAHGLHVRLGDDEADHRWKPDVREEIHSVSKGICVLAAGIAQDEGLISLDDRIATLLPDMVTGADVEQVTMRHLLNMTSGIDLPWSESMMTDHPDLAAEFLSRPSRGRIFQYSNASTYTAMTALSQRTGDLEAFVRSRLFEPVGITDVVWRRCPNGRVLAGEGISLRTEELALIGKLIHDRGVWEGRRIVSAELVDAMHSAWVEKGGTYKGYERYALAGWGGPGDGWRLHGAYGQLVIFADEAVVTITANDHPGADAIAAFVVEKATSLSAGNTVQKSELEAVCQSRPVVAAA